MAATTEETKEKAVKQDKYHGVGGRYIQDPKTGVRKPESKFKEKPEKPEKPESKNNTSGEK